jgi:hypothetical protein
LHPHRLSDRLGKHRGIGGRIFMAVPAVAAGTVHEDASHFLELVEVAQMEMRPAPRHGRHALLRYLFVRCHIDVPRRYPDPDRGRIEPSTFTLEDRSSAHHWTCGRFSACEPQHLMPSRPRDGCIEQAGDADSVWEPTVGGVFDEIR